MNNPVMRREIFQPALAAEMMPLLAAHWAEVSHYPDILLNPDVEYYTNLEAGGFFRVYTLRNEGVLKGYAAFTVRQAPHYSQSKQAYQDVIYVDPAMRGLAPLRFIRFCDSELRREGVQAVYHHVKVAHNFGRILERQGYEPVDIIYAKRLDRED